MKEKYHIWLILFIIIFYAGCGDSREDIYEEGKKVGFEQGYNKGYAKGKQDALKDLNKSPTQYTYVATIKYLGALFIIGLAATIIVWVATTKKGARKKDLQDLHETLKEMQEDMNKIKTSLADLTIQSADRL